MPSKRESVIFFKFDQPYVEQITGTDGYRLDVDFHTLPANHLASNMHWHNYFEAEVICGGSGSHIYDGVRVPLSRGSAHIITPADQHAVHSDPDSPLQIFNLRFTEAALQKEALHAITERKGCITAFFNNERLDNLLRQIDTLLFFMKSEPPHQDILRLTLSQICLDILHSAYNSDRTENREKTVYNSIIKDTIWYIRCHFRDKLTMQDLANHVGYTPNYLGALYKQATGQSCAEYILQLRTQYAQNLLTNTTLPLEEIATESGFSTTSYFISQFRKQTGVTPSKYRETHKL